jgi:hypothetical protein
MNRSRNLLNHEKSNFKLLPSRRHVLVESCNFMIQPKLSVSKPALKIDEQTFQQDHDTRSNLPIHTTEPTYPLPFSPLSNS